MKYSADKYNMVCQSESDFLRLLQVYKQAIDLNIICSITDTKGKILYVNNKFCEISKFDKKELIGQNHNIMSAGFHPNDFFKNMWETISSGVIWEGELKSKSKDGSYFWLNTSILPIYDENDSIIQYFSLRIPIDDKKKSEEERKEHIRSLQEMIFMTSHRIRQPIANIIGITNEMEDSLSSKEDLLEMIGYLKESAQSLDTYTRELSTFIYETKNKEQLYNC
jgi:PAS domain S-box-containing protein